MSAPQFSFPFELVGNDFNVVEQDTPEEIADCVLVLMLTPVGSRIVQPNYGTTETLFSQEPIPTAVLQSQIQLWEPRATVDLEQTLSRVDDKVVHLQINVQGGQS